MNNVFSQSVKYLGTYVEPKPRETSAKWCQAVSENNNDSSAIFWPRWEQVVISRAFSIFSLTFPIPQTYIHKNTYIILKCRHTFLTIIPGFTFLKINLKNCTALYFANRKILNKFHDSFSSRWDSVLAIGLVLVTAHLRKHHVWSNS